MESRKDFDRQMQEIDRQINERLGVFPTRFGEMVEYMVAPNLQDKFWEMGFNFHKSGAPSKYKDNREQYIF